MDATARTADATSTAWLRRNLSALSSKVSSGSQKSMPSDGDPTYFT